MQLSRGRGTLELPGCTNDPLLKIAEEHSGAVGGQANGILRANRIGSASSSLLSIAQRFTPSGETAPLDATPAAGDFIQYQNVAYRSACFTKDAFLIHQSPTLSMKRTFWHLVAAFALISAASATLFAHDLFLLPEAFFVTPGSSVNVKVLNGTFDKSEGAVAMARIRDLSVVTPSGRMAPPRAGWRATGDTAVFPISVGQSGTYVIGLSTLDRTINLEAKDFNEYLATEGSPGILAQRKRTGEDTLPARERYSKHVKAVFQAGSTRSSSYSTVLGYPAELVPLNNPYALGRGKALRVRALVEGKPEADQLLYYGGRKADGTPVRERSVRTDRSGAASVRIPTSGHWYIKFIHMVKVPRDTVEYESKWATLTFGTR